MKMKWQNGLRSGCLLLLVISLSAIVSTARRTNNFGASGLAVLQIEDPAPGNALMLGQRYFTGNGIANDCSFYELQLAAERSAVALGANVVKIVSKTSHSRAQRCDGLEVAFYRSEQPKAAEQSFRWQPSRSLTWDDFEGPVRRGAGNNIAAETSCGIAIETSLVGNQDKAKVYVFNTFDKQASWVRDGYMRSDVLQHEQGHWDICEMYTRLMQARFDQANITGANLKQEVARIYNEVSDEYLARQEQYEQETQHGIIAEEQNRWTRMLVEELSTSSVSKL